MKSLILFFSIILTTQLTYAQEADTTAQPETFEYEWAGEQLTMQKYFIVFLKSGENRSQDQEKAMKLQQEHLTYLGDLYEKGIINLNGPSGGEGDIRGFSVYNVATIEQAREYAENDPMVRAGRLKVEVHPWWLAKGSGVK
ncbi:YciI family protein [Gracilimonas amylolytica]|uniref:YciI family protein n=1 Tax=Gracilimonas amylolytica TaxID=1749045 RepID=UPI000CD8F562|nr:YciI family protein [Gracilimonas amylolytica]